MNQWYYGSQGQQNGPMAESELRRLIGQGTITQATLVWREGLLEWKPLSSVTELHLPPVIGMAPMPYAQIPGYAPNSALAIASMVCGIVSIMMCYVHAVSAIPAVICGHMALKKIRESEIPMAGRGMAIAGLVTGYLGILIQLAMIVAATLFYVNMSKMSSSSTSSPSMSPSPIITTPTSP